MLKLKRNVENILIVITFALLIILGSIDDFEFNLKGILVILAMFLIMIFNTYVLLKYGRCFEENETGGEK